MGKNSRTTLPCDDCSANAEGKKTTPLGLNLHLSNWREGKSAERDGLVRHVNIVSCFYHNDCVTKFMLNEIVEPPTLVDVKKMYSACYRH